MALPTGSTIIKDPQSVLPKGIDWTGWLDRIDPGGTIITSTWAVTGPDALLTVSSASIITGALKTQMRLTGGTYGGQYTVTNHITTSTGVQEDGSFNVIAEHK